MKIKAMAIVSGVLSILCSSCEKELVVEGLGEPNSSLNIITRADGGDVSYPITIYVMNKDNTCIKQETIASSEQSLSLDMEAAQYTIYAIAGATATNYNLPDKDDATPTTEIALLAGKKHADLMAASSAVEISANETNNVVLGLQRKVMMLQTVTINDVPASVDAVTLTLSALHKNLKVNGEYSEATESQSVELTEQADGKTWKTTDGVFLLPGTETTAISVALTRGSETKSYTYTPDKLMTANHKFSITGTCTDKDLYTLSGTITGVTWGDDESITFNFGAGGGTFDDDPSTPSGDVIDEATPSIRTMYKHCYVLSVDDSNDGYNEVTLLHKDDITDLYTSGMSMETLESNINTALAAISVEGVTATWKVPTKEQAERMIEEWSSIQSTLADAPTAIVLANEFYIYNDGEKLNTFISTRGMDQQTFDAKTRLRPITTLKFAK